LATTAGYPAIFTHDVAVSITSLLVASGHITMTSATICIVVAVVIIIIALIIKRATSCEEEEQKNKN
jgi:hypothetical protein